jgi:phage-related protein
MKPLHFMGSSLNDLRALPSDVRREAGFAISVAQEGGKALHAFPLVGFGGGSVLEVVINEAGNTYRAVYTVKFEMAVYVLHVFQKKSKRGSETPRPDVQLIKRRFNAAAAHYKLNYGSKIRKDVSA